MNVELLFDDSCPNIEQARADLRAAFSALGLAPRWTERRCDGFGSPTVLVDGADVLPVDAMAGSDCCRVYPERDGSLRGSPGRERIEAAMRRARSRAGWPKRRTRAV